MEDFTYKLIVTGVNIKPIVKLYLEKVGIKSDELAEVIVSCLRDAEDAQNALDAILAAGGYSPEGAELILWITVARMWETNNKGPLSIPYATLKRDLALLVDRAGRSTDVR